MHRPFCWRSLMLKAQLDLSIYAVHAVFWVSFGLTRMMLKSKENRDPVKSETPAAQEEKTAPFSRALLALHTVAFFVMYFGVAQAVLPAQVPQWFVGQRLVGTLTIAAGASLMCWALVFFRSWRFRAKLDEGHQLATGGPFALMRHPIYMGLNLLALGTAIWVPTWLVWGAFLMMVIGSDLRGRAEEKLLVQAFGDSYRAYSSSTRRFLPGLY
jgi:protein-S-isoprenylcysteine O-methyltransferase Ste14